MRLIDADILEKEGWSLCRTYQKDKETMVYEVKAISEINTAQPDVPDTNVGDMIYRQAAIKELLSLNDQCNSVYYMKCIDDAVYALEILPSAQSEIVRCKNCKHGMYDVMCKFYWCHGVAHSANWFCADGKRRE